MKRRDFLKAGAISLITAPYVLSGKYFYSSGNEASRIISVRDDLASNLTFTPGKVPDKYGQVIDRVDAFSINSNHIAKMIDEAIMKLNDQDSVAKAWESIFPEGKLNTGTKIGIKLNFAYGWMDDTNDWNKMMCPYGPKAAISDAIISGLTSMLDGHFPINNITLYDLGLAIIPGKANAVIQGYRPVLPDAHNVYRDKNPKSFTLHWLSARNPQDVPEEAPTFLAAPDYPEPYQAPQKILPPVYENDFLINIAVAKDHRSAGVTGVMKNTFGCTDNCASTHGNQWMNLDTPYPGTRLCVPVFYEMINQHCPVVLNVLDALAGVYQGGPTTGRVFHPNIIAMSKDPVAIDSYLLHMVNQARKTNDCSELSLQDGRASDGHPNAPSLRVAEEKHNLGSTSLQNLQQINLTGEKTGYRIPELDRRQFRLNDPARASGIATLGIHFDHSGRKQTLNSWIENIHGESVRNFRSISTYGPSATQHWDLRNNNKKIVPKGIYIWHVMSGDHQLSKTIRIGH